MKLSFEFWIVGFLVLVGPLAVLAQPYGIGSRAPNTALLINDLPADTPGTMQLTRVFPRLTFSSPVLMIEAPDGSGRLFVVQRSGLIKVFAKSADPAPGSVSTFLDIQSRVLNLGEQGLLGLAFDPGYASNGRIYVYYSRNNGGVSPGPSTISRFTNDNPADNSVSAATEEILLQVSQPAPHTNHKGGMIAIGPDGYLYAGLGDGGDANDPNNNAQTLSTHLGKMLRIDVTSTPAIGEKYVIPPDNPFAADLPATGRKKEIYAWGLRNPWRWSFDQQTGRLYLADVGQDAYEEIDIIQNGGNYGWKIMEGTHCRGGGTGCSTAGYILPIVDYGRTDGQAIVGGFVSYSTAVPDLYGMYIYTDYSSRRIWALRYDGSTVSGPFVLVDLAAFAIAGFGQDAAGEVYALQFSGSGGVYVLRPAAGPGPSDFPVALSEIPSLLNAGLGVDQTNLGILPYEPSAKLWSDGAAKGRFLALPGAAPVDYQQEDGWDFPEKSVIVKNFAVALDERDPGGAQKRIETRLLYRRNGAWHGFSYEWNEDETDAILLTDAKSRTISVLDQNGLPFDLTWRYPSRLQCNQCHTTAANGVLGLNTAQMNFDFTFPASGVTDNELRTYDHIGLFSAALPGAPATLPRMPDPADESASLQDRARAYISANCSHCHRPGGSAPTVMDFRWPAANDEMYAIGFPPSQGDLGIPGAQIIKAGDPDASIVIARMESLDPAYRMPPLATSRVDEEGATLVRDWIASLAVLPGVGPTVTMSSATGNPTNVSPIPVTVMFGQPVTGFVVGDISATGATVGGFSGSGASYAFTLTPTGQGTVTANIPAGVAFNVANDGNQATSPFTRTYDSLPPTAVVRLIDPNPTDIDTVHFEVDFAGAIQSGSFTAADMTVVGLPGTVAVGLVQPGTVYPVTVTLTDPFANGTIGITVGTQVWDTAGNAFAGVSSPVYTINNDGVTPTPTPTGTPTPTPLPPARAQNWKRYR